MRKEIYINDVDVSECEKLTRVLHNCKSKQVYDKVYEPCACKNNCEYKQLKRTEKEIEELKEDYTELFQRHDDAFKDFNNLKQENLTISYNLGLKEGECAKYKAALEEIKNYVLDNTDFDKGDDIQSKTAGYDILHKIYEVLK